MLFSGALVNKEPETLSARRDRDRDFTECRRKQQTRNQRDREFANSEDNLSVTPWRPGDTLPPDRMEPSAQALGGVTKVNLIVNDPTISLTKSNGGIQYYNADDGYFYRLGADGKTEKLAMKFL